MLIEFAVTNYRSIKEEARLSFVAGSGNEHRETNVCRPELASSSRPPDVLRSAAIYGPNAAGKSNLLKAIDIMKQVVAKSSGNIDAQLPVEPFAFDKRSSSQPTAFEAIFLVNGVRYQYGFSATRETIHEEWLFAWPLGRTQVWFERHPSESSGSSFKFGDKLSGDREVWRRATRPNALFLSTAASLNSAQLKPIWDWFNSRLQVVVDGWHPQFTLSYCKDESNSSVVSFLTAADIAIDGVRVSEEKFTPEMLPDDMPSSIKEEILKDLAGSSVLSAVIKHVPKKGQALELELEEESVGTQKMFALSGPWMDVLNKGRIIVIDELDNSLHPNLVHFLIQRFHDPSTNRAGAQLVFSTHNTTILNQEVFRRDQIWFCERNRNLATSVFPLTDFRPRKGHENLERAYLSGRYGAVPHVRPSEWPSTRLRVASGQE